MSNHKKSAFYFMMGRSGDDNLRKSKIMSNHKNHKNQRSILRWGDVVLRLKIHHQQTKK